MTQLEALVATLLIETAVVMPLLRMLKWTPSGRWWAPLPVIFAASLLTHPFAWTLIVEMRGWAPSFWTRAIPVELALTVAEGLLYAWLLPVSRRRGLVLSVAANGTSFGVGLLL